MRKLISSSTNNLLSKCLSKLFVPQVTPKLSYPLSQQKTSFVSFYYSSSSNKTDGQNFNKYLENYQKAIKHNQNKQYDNAIQLLTSILEVEQNVWQVYYQRAQSYLKLRKINQCLNDLQKAEKINGYSWQIYMLQGFALVQIHKFEEALIKFDKAIELNPGNAEFYLLRANIKNVLGNKQSARQDFVKAKQLNPSLQIPGQEKESQIDMILKEILKEFQSKNYQQAFDIIANSLKNYPQEPRIHQLKVGINLTLKNYKQALEHQNTLIQINPKQLKNYYMRCSIYGLLGDIPKAVDQYQRCLQTETRPQFMQRKEGSNLPYYPNLQGSYQNLVHHMKQFQLDYVELFYFKGFCQLNLQMFEEAISSSTRFIDGYFGSSKKKIEGINFCPEKAYLCRGNAYFITNKFTEAASDLEEYLKHHLKNQKPDKNLNEQQIYLLLIQCQNNSKQWLKTSSQFQIYIFLGTIYQKLNNHQKSKDNYTKALLIKPQKYLYFKIANSNYALLNFQQAQKDYKTCIQMDSLHFPAHINLAHIYRKKKQYQKVIGSCNEVFNIMDKFQKENQEAIKNNQPPQRNYLNQIKQRIEFVRRLRGPAYQAVGKLENALEDYEQLGKINPKHEQLSMLRLSIYLNLKKLDKALSQATNIINHNPISKNYHLRSAIYLKDIKNKQKALQDIDEAIKISPNQTQSYQMKGVILTQLNQIQQALKSYTKCIELSPQNGHFYYSRAFVYQLLNKYEEAISDFSMSLQKDPQNLKVYKLRGQCYAKIMKFEQAVHDFSMALKQTPDSAVLYDMRAAALRILGKIDEAVLDEFSAINLRK